MQEHEALARWVITSVASCFTLTLIWKLAFPFLPLSYKSRKWLSDLYKHRQTPRAYHNYSFWYIGIGWDKLFSKIQIRWPDLICPLMNQWYIYSQSDCCTNKKKYLQWPKIGTTTKWLICFVVIVRNTFPIDLSVRGQILWCKFNIMFWNLQ